MVLADLVMHFGRTAASIANNICRPDMLVGRGARFLAGAIGPRSDNVRGEDHDALVLPLSTDYPSDATKISMNNLAFVNQSRRQEAKGLLNAINNKTQVLSQRSICSLTCPMSIDVLRVLPDASNIISKQPNRTLRRRNCNEWCRTDPCTLMRPNSIKKPSIWLDPPCYSKMKCRKIFRYDIKYMPGSNKATRQYQQTWIECPPLRIIPKAVCCKKKLQMPICRRPRKIRPKTASYCGTTNTCKIKGKKCPKLVQLPCCDVGRKDPKCHIRPGPSCCKKRCTPFPSFSECCRPPSNKKPRIECRCLAPKTVCEVHADWRKRYRGTRFRPFKFKPLPVM